MNTHQEYWIITITHSDIWHWTKDNFVLDQSYRCSDQSQFLPTTDIKVATWYSTAEEATIALRRFNEIHKHFKVGACVVKFQYTISF